MVALPTSTGLLITKTKQLASYSDIAMDLPLQYLVKFTS